MNDDYLWDPRGGHAPDEEVEALERKLAPFRHGAAPGAAQPRSAVRPRAAHPRFLAWPWLAAAAIAALAAVAVLAARRESASSPVGSAPDEHDLALEAAAGATVEDAAGAAKSAAAALVPGDRVIARATASVRVGTLGEVELEPGASVRVGASPAGAYRLILERGSLTASILAPPRRFAVGTPAGDAVDLGCVYAARVEPDGSTLVSVRSGAVAFEATDREAYVPAGASLRAGGAEVALLPVRDDADPALQEAIRAIGRSATPPETALAALRSARTADSLTLYHVLRHPSAAARGHALKALDVLGLLPREVDPEAVLVGDGAALARLREAMPW